MENINFLIDEETGLEYLVNLPVNWRPACISDFHVKGKKKIGMLFLIRSFNDWFFPYHVYTDLTAAKLQERINQGIIFVPRDPGDESEITWPLAIAENWANDIMELLRPHCERLEIAGSIRRKKSRVGDIEIVAIPKPYETGIFESGLAKVVNQWPKVKGELEYGITRYTQRILHQTIKLDLFFAVPDNWGMILAIRTGSADFSHKFLAARWSKLGYRSEHGYLIKGEKTINVREETELFELLGLKYVEPQNRNL